MSEPKDAPDKAWLQAQWEQQRLFDAAGIGSWIRSVDGSRVLWSPGLKKLFGFPGDSNPDMEDVYALMDAAVRSEVQAAAHRGRETGEVFTVEYVVHRADGTDRWVEATAQWIRSNDGETLYVQGIAKDITERKQEELQRQDSERRMRALMESSSDVLFRLDPDFSKILQVIGRDFVADTHEPRADWLESYIQEIDRERVMAAVAAAVQQGRRFELEFRVYRRDGSLGWAMARVVPLVLPDGQIQEWVGMATDITEAKRLNLELERHRVHLEDLVASRTRSLTEAGKANELLASRLEMACRAARIGTWYSSFRDDLTIWDDRMYELFGMQRKEGESSPPLAAWFRRIPREDRGVVHEQALESGRLRIPTDVDCRVELPNGMQRTLRVSSLVESDALGMPIRIVGTCEDVTADRQAAQDLLDAKAAAEDGNAAKSRFIAAASHDLRQPLAAANLYLDILKDSVTPGISASLVERVRGSTESLSSMLDGLLDVARLDTAAMMVRHTMVPLWKLAQWVREEFSEQFRVRGLRLTLRFPHRDLSLRTDETFIKGILRNLLVNALKYTERGGVLVALRVRRSKLVFQVWDTGIGIAGEHLPYMFDEFYQVGNAARDSSKGLGLGLSIVQRKVRLLGGNVQCRSRPGRGTVFDIELPKEQLLATAAVTGPSSSESGEFPLGWVENCCICLVEDASAVREALSLLLAGWGMRVFSFPDAVSALESPDIASADFVITDFRLPGALNGIELLQELHRRRIEPLRCVLLTGEIDLPESPNPSGWPWPVLRKPCDQRVLWKALTG